MLIVNNVIHKAINNEFIKIIDKKITPKTNEFFNKYPFLKQFTLNNSKIFTDTDITVEYNNKWQSQTALLICGFLIIISILYPFILKYTCGICIPVTNIIILNAVIFVFIGLAEYLFFSFFAMKYIPIKPSDITTLLLNNIKNILQN
jgi:hypothetical protein